MSGITGLEVSTKNPPSVIKIGTSPRKEYSSSPAEGRRHSAQFSWSMDANSKVDSQWGLEVKKAEN